MRDNLVAVVLCAVSACTYVTIDTGSDSGPGDAAADAREADADAGDASDSRYVACTYSHPITEDAFAGNDTCEPRFDDGVCPPAPCSDFDASAFTAHYFCNTVGGMNPGPALNYDCISLGPYSYGADFCCSRRDCIHDTVGCGSSAQGWACAGDASVTYVQGVSGSTTCESVTSGAPPGDDAGDSYWCCF